MVSPDTDSKDKDAFDGGEELPEAECEEEKDAEPNDEEWSKQGYCFRIEFWNATFGAQKN